MLEGKFQTSFPKRLHRRQTNKRRKYDVIRPGTSLKTYSFIYLTALMVEIEFVISLNPQSRNQESLLLDWLRAENNHQLLINYTQEVHTTPSLPLCQRFSAIISASLEMQLYHVPFFSYFPWQSCFACVTLEGKLHTLLRSQKKSKTNKCAHTSLASAAALHVRAANGNSSG